MIHQVESVSSIITSAVEQQNIVTSEISRTVEETSEAARQVAAQIASVSREANETGRRASEMRDGSLEIAKMVDDLRSTLVRVIRTSTTDVDRRTSARIALHRPGKLRVAGQLMTVTVRDIALGGAMLDQAMPELSIDTPVMLNIDRVPVDLVGFVARKGQNSTLIKFNLTGAAAEVLKAKFAALKAA